MKYTDQTRKKILNFGEQHPLFNEVFLEQINLTPEKYPDFFSGMSPVQIEAVKKLCPHCEEGYLHGVDPVEETGEVYLWCNTCDLSMDSDGGYIA